MVRDLHHNEIFINGTFAAPHGSTRIEVISPNSEELIGSVPEASPADVDDAVAAARRAFDDPRGWSTWEPARRADAIERLASALEKRGEDLSQLVSAQNGMPISIARSQEVGFAQVVYRYYAGLVRNAPEVEVRDGYFGGQALVERKPVGVVAAIVPWNFPQVSTAMKVAPALAAGCTVVLKPSPETVLDSYVLAEAAIEAGLPAGVINIVPGGREVGAYLVGHPGVNKVSFTGSTVAGRQVAETSGRLLRPATLELGGKSAAIILDDADLDAISQNLFDATLFNNGQTCFLGTRILAPKSRHDDIVELLVHLVSRVTVGNSLDDSTQVGPMTSSRQRARVEGYIATGLAEGGRIATGGHRPEHLTRGWFVEPTIFVNVTNDQTIAREEIFGPVLTVIPYDTIDEAVALANDSDYGLGGSVWSQDTDRALAVAKRVETGTMGINHYAPDPVAPYGGVRSSGLGRELGPEGLAEYQQFKSTYLPAGH
jgi:aldehyde dehydrogenase (NAD+)